MSMLQYLLPGVCIVAGIYYWWDEDRQETALYRWGLRPLMVGSMVLVWTMPWSKFLDVLQYPLVAWILGGLIWLLLRYLANSQAKGSDKHRRGAQLADARELGRKTKHQAAGLTVGGVPIPAELETLHIAFAGGTGSGKSCGITEMLDAIQARRDRMIIADSGGVYLERLAREGDWLLNPYDARCAAWSPLAEMRSERDADSMAKSFIPDGEGKDKQWSDWAQTILSEILRKCWAGGKATNADLYRLCCCTDRKELFQFLAGTPAAPMVDPNNSSMGANVFSMVVSAARVLRYLPADAGRDGFSIRRWVTEGEGNLYLTYLDEQLDSLRAQLAAWLDLAAKAIVSLPEERGRRIWLVADELDSLGRVGSLKTFLTKARRLGGCAILGVQSVAQLRETYGRDTSQTLMSCLSNWVILRQADPESADHMARLIGRAEVLRTQKSGGKNGQGESENWSEQLAQTSVVMDSELMNLPAREGYLILAGDYPTARISLEIPPERHSGFEAFVQDENDPSPEDLKESDGQEHPPAPPAPPAPAKPAAPAAPTIRIPTDF